MGFAINQFGAAIGTGIGIETGIGITHTDFGLHVQVAGKNLRITVSNTGTYKPSLITTIRKFGQITTQKRNVILQVTHIVLSTVSMNAHKMTGKTITEPIACLRLQ